MKISTRTAVAAAVIAAAGAAVPALGAAPNPQGGTGTAGCNDGTVTWTPTNLWPPNHKMVPVTISYSDSDGDGDNTALMLNSVTETDGSTSSDATMPDTLKGSGAPGSVQGPDAMTDATHPATTGSDGGADATWTEDLRAERSGTDGHGGGRTYTLNITCSDMGGTDMNETTGESQTIDIVVTVPHDQGVVK